MTLAKIPNAGIINSLLFSMLADDICAMKSDL